MLDLIEDLVDVFIIAFQFAVFCVVMVLGFALGLAAIWLFIYGVVLGAAAVGL